MAHDVTAAPRAPDRRIPKPMDALLFDLKTRAFQLRRTILDAQAQVARLPRAASADYPICIAKSRSPLWADPRLAEASMQRGKVHNLRAAARQLDGTLLPAGAVFSFWAQMGKATRARGFVAGRMLQEGCLVASAGGGLCQLSNALYQVALDTGCEIVERHAHSRLVPGSAAATGRDATVAWNYVDLRFRAPRDLLLRVSMDRQSLIVALFAAAHAPASAGAPVAEAETRTRAHDCATCGETSCFRHGEGRGEARGGARAFVVDEFWPEFDAYIGDNWAQGDVLCAPLDARAKRANYAWRPHGKSVTAPISTLIRAQRSRKLAAQGAERQRALLKDADRIAARLARGLTADVTDVCVALPFLSYLWRNGHLGGRRFAVLMTRPPLSALHAKLDAAAARHPDRRTLADFRAPAASVALEDAALAEAAALITPHTEIADLFGERAVLLPWRAPKVAPAPRTASKRVAFPGPTVARKGAFELRAAALALDLEVQPMGAEIEGPDFWNGVRVHRGESWLDAAVIVQPALVEDKPRRLLRALAAGVPVIATPACGLPPQAGLWIIPEDNERALIEALREVFALKAV